jgi:hypothetical protein
MFGASTAGANDSTVIAVAQEKAKSRLKDGREINFCAQF